MHYKKLKHYVELGSIYFVTSVTYERCPIFKDNIAASFLKTSFLYHKYILNYKLYGFVIMPDHFHLLIQPTDKKYNISKIMNFIKGTFSRKYNKLINNTGKILQKGFYDKIMRQEKDVLKSLEYIHYNPIKKDLVKKPEDYLYSSYNLYYNKDLEKILDPLY